MSSPPRILFLPGASGTGAFWRPVADRIPIGWEKKLLDWPGAGHQPHDPGIQGFDDLIAVAAEHLEERSDVVAQSMGGVVAMGLALRFPERIRRIVLVATSGGMDLKGHNAEEWRADYRATFPSAAAWVREERPDFSASIPTINAPTCLIWGDSDPISPVSVGRRLAEMLRHSELHVLRGGTHSLAHDNPAEVAALITAHLA